MDVHEALEEVKAQKEELGEEVRIKTDLCNNLKSYQDKLLTKLQESTLQYEKQAQELSAKCEELSALSKQHQDLKSHFQEQELSIKHLHSANEKIKLEYEEKLQKVEGENKELVLALEEAITTSESLKSKVDSSNKEIEHLKSILLLKDKKIVEISTLTTKDLIQRDEVISNLEDEYRDVQDQLKWKNEQFQHLEEAHEKLQDDFKFSKTEWEKEISLLLQGLDSQTRTCENLQNKYRDVQNQLEWKNEQFQHLEEAHKKLQDDSQTRTCENLQNKYKDVKDQLEWKNEQFQHLEEAHKKLQDDFKFSKTEWEKEIALLLQEKESKNNRSKLVDDLLIEMERASKEMEEYANDVGDLNRLLLNI